MVKDSQRRSGEASYKKLNKYKGDPIGNGHSGVAAPPRDGGDDNTITAFAVAVSVGLFYPSLTSILMFCGCNVRASRGVPGMHLLSD
jgi:hypothetical protein